MFVSIKTHLFFFLQLHLALDPAARVRVSALDTLTACLDLIKDLPRSDANIFPEYILPSIATLATDSAVVVRIAYARNIGKLQKRTQLFKLAKTNILLVFF